MTWLKTHWLSLATFLVFCATTLVGIGLSYGSLSAKLEERSKSTDRRLDSVDTRLTRIEGVLMTKFSYADRIPTDEQASRNSLPLAGDNLASGADGVTLP